MRPYPSSFLCPPVQYLLYSYTGFSPEINRLFENRKNYARIKEQHIGGTGADIRKQIKKRKGRANHGEKGYAVI